MFLLDTNLLLKILIFEEQKDMWVNEIFEGREKMGNSTCFSSVVGTTVQVL
jgi:predicted nucleic-acid-binding protein